MHHESGRNQRVYSSLATACTEYTEATRYTCNNQLIFEIFWKSTQPSEQHEETHLNIMENRFQTFLGKAQITYVLFGESLRSLCETGVSELIRDKDREKERRR